MKSKVFKRLVQAVREPGVRTEKKCKICKEPMLVAPGQVAFYHKACRKLRNRKNR